MKVLTLLSAALWLAFSGFVQAESETESLTKSDVDFVPALMGEKADKPKRTQVTEGRFKGIEEGDYFHWNMINSAGEEFSFFILKPDATVDKVLENPKSYVGKKCRVTWKKSTEDIPEAGGKIEIETILSVEWLGK